MREFLVIIMLFSLLPGYAQNQAGKFGLEITKLKIGLNVGPYRGRTPQTDGFFDQGIAFVGQAYFPFQLAADYRANFKDTTSITNEYNNRVFLLRPNAIFHFVDKGSMAFGLGLQISFLLGKSFYLEYQLSEVYVEANNAGAPDLYDGFNLHHYASVSKPISRHFSMSFGFMHMSGAGLSTGRGANQDTLTLGVKWNL
jgi:hypothetical protein